VRRALVATTGGALPEVVGTDGETRPFLVAPTPEAHWLAIGRTASTTPSCVPARRDRTPGACCTAFTWKVTAEGDRRVLRGRARWASAAPAPSAIATRRGRLMLTVNYDRLGLRPGDRLLDLGCGFGRHAFEAARRGAKVVALDAGDDEVAGCA